MTQLLNTARGDIIIRSATTQDAQALFKLRIEALMAEPEAFAADAEITQAKGIKSWMDQIQHDIEDESGIIITAWQGQELIAMSGLGRGHWPKTRHSAIVWGVYVNKAWRGLRIADAMLEESISWAREHGIVVLKLGVVTTNLAAIRCYERCGFSVYGTEPKSNQLDGKYFDEYLMARLIEVKNKWPETQ